MRLLHFLSALSCLAAGILNALYGEWQAGIIFFALILYFNCSALDVELQRHRAFGEPHPGRRILFWCFMCMVFSIVGCLVHLRFA